MTLHLTTEQIIHDLEQIVADVGASFTHTGYCSYFDEDSGQPRCLVGRIIARHAVTLNDVLGWNSHGVEALFHAGILSGEPQAQALLEGIQSDQDNHHPYGRVLNDANQYVASPVWAER
jgi:hypothetical protein